MYAKEGPCFPKAHALHHFGTPTKFNPKNVGPPPPEKFPFFCCLFTFFFTFIPPGQISKKKLKFKKNSPTQKPPLVRPQKCQSFVHRLRGTLFPEGNQLSVISLL